MIEKVDLEGGGMNNILSPAIPDKGNGLCYEKRYDWVHW